MIRAFHIAALLLIACVGLHIPRSFALLYLFAGIVLALNWLERGASELAIKVAPRYKILQGVLFLALFSIAYVVGMLWWRLWIWPADAPDLVNALLLPSLLFLVGTKAASFKRIWTTRILLAYGAGGLVYGLAALAVARTPWWNVGQAFYHSIQVAWGSLVELNIRSVEQTVYPALLLFPPALLLMLGQRSNVNRELGITFLGISALGAHAVLSMNSRLGWLALVLAVIPILSQLCSRSFANSMPARLNFLVILAASLIFIATWKYVHSIKLVQAPSIWRQGLCDERFSLFGSMLIRLHQAPWGGRVLRAPFALCGFNLPTSLLAADGGTLAMAHNVILDIYFNVGVIPVLLLLIALVPCMCGVFRAFHVAWPRWDWQLALQWSWVCLLLCQWLFQPLLYSDGLLYYFSFFVMGAFATQARARSFIVDSTHQSLCHRR